MTDEFDFQGKSNAAKVRKANQGSGDDSSNLASESFPKEKSPEEKECTCDLPDGQSDNCVHRFEDEDDEDIERVKFVDYQEADDVW